MLHIHECALFKTKPCVLKKLTHPLLDGVAGVGPGLLDAVPWCVVAAGMMAAGSNLDKVPEEYLLVCVLQGQWDQLCRSW